MQHFNICFSALTIHEQLDNVKLLSSATSQNIK